MISKGHVAKGIKRLLDFARDFSNDNEELNRAITISADYNTIKKMNDDGDFSIDEFLRHRRRMIIKALELLTEIIENQPQAMRA